MARQERPPISSNPARRSSRAPLITGVVLVGGLVAAAVGATLLGRGQSNPESTTPTPTPGLVSEPPKTIVPATEAPKTPTVKPTEKSLTPQELIAIIRKTQQEASSKGELKVPQPGIIVSEGGNLNDIFVVQTNANFSTINGVPSGKEISFPSLIDGVVLESRTINRNTTSIKIQMDKWVLDFHIPSYFAPSVQNGQKVELNSTLFTIKYDPENPVQKGFEQSGIGSGAGTVVKIFARLVTDAQDVSNFSTKSNIIRNQEGQPISLP